MSDRELGPLRSIMVSADASSEECVFPLAISETRKRIDKIDNLLLTVPAVNRRITGDGRCLFRSVAYGACVRRGKQSPSDSTQKELADELRAKVADEFVKRRGDTEWFLEGDFESYVRKMRKPHAWGGEPELLMCSHVLRMPITVYMYTSSSDGPRIIAEYGQEYGKDNPVRVLYDGYGHYDALQPSLERSVDNRRLRSLSFFRRAAAQDVKHDWQQLKMPR